MSPLEKLTSYYGKEITISGNNLELTEESHPTFKHFHEHFNVDLLSLLEYYKQREIILKQAKEILSFSERNMFIKQKNKELIDEINQREQAGEFLITAEYKKRLLFLEKLYISALTDKSPVTPLKIEDGKVIMPITTPYHNCTPRSVENLKTFADLGILASEWFGIFESAGEARFCTFVQNDSIKNNNATPNTEKKSIRFYIDTKSLLWKKLASLDYFEYANLKQKSPEKVQELYSPEIIDLYETIIGHLSRAGNCMHDSPNSHFMTWQAIPAGIPPQLIVGIQIGSEMQEFNTPKALNEIQGMFPNATIFNENKELITPPPRIIEDTTEK